MKRSVFILATLLATTAFTQAQTTRYWINATTSAAYVVSGNWDPTGTPVANDTMIFTNVDFGGIRHQTITYAGATNYAGILAFNGGTTAGGLAMTNRLFSTAGTGQLHVYDQLLIGQRDDSNVRLHLANASAANGTFVTNALGTATIWIGGTNTGIGALLASDSLRAVDRLYTTNTGFVLGGAGGYTLTINQESRVNFQSGDNPGNVNLITFAGGMHVWTYTNLPAMTAQNNSGSISFGTGLHVKSGATLVLQQFSGLQLRGTATHTFSNATVYLGTGVFVEPSSANQTLRMHGSMVTGTVFHLARITAMGAVATNNMVYMTGGNTLLSSEVNVGILTAGTTTTNTFVANNGVVVDNSVWTNTGRLNIGRYERWQAGGNPANFVSNNFVTVQNNARVHVGGNVVVGLVTNNPTGFGGIGGNQLNVNGGTMTVGGAVDARHGAVNVAGGNLTVGSLFATNGAGNSALNISAGTLRLNNLTVNNGGAFAFSGGTLSALNVVQNNGSPLTVGDGSGAAATLNLRNGATVNAANGLVLAGDAVLDIGNSVGTATVAGDVTFNSGTTWNLDWNGNHVGDVLNVTGNVQLAGTINVSLGYTPALFDKLTNLVVFGGYAIDGDFGSVNVVENGGSLTNGSWYLTFNKAAGDSIGYLEVVPEPSALTLVGFALAITAVVILRRRR